MKSRYLRLLLGLAALCCGLSFGAPPKPKQQPKAKPVRKAARYRAPVVSAAQRAAALDQARTNIADTYGRFENASALAPFLNRLGRMGKDSRPLHILQFGDSHTASDDWVNAMRLALQAKYGDGGAGFIHAGRPYRGFRHFGAPASMSAGWETEGTLASPGDGREGLSGISITANRRGETVSLTSSAQDIMISWLQQPGGGSFYFLVDDHLVDTIQTSGEQRVGVYQFLPVAGEHRYEIRTASSGPVRLLGWTADNAQGITVETAGINGAQASMILRWDEELWRSEVARREPALVILAYGTNEANSRRFEPEEYRADLTAVIAKVRRAAPGAAILLVGPPDCGRGKPLPHLDEVIAVQRTVAAEASVAFWNWREQMGEGGKNLWVRAGLAQADFIHLTGDGYRLLGQTLVEGLESQHASLSLVH